MNQNNATTQALSIAMMGSGGAGAITAGSMLLEAAGRAGWYGLMTRSVGPQIRGGEALAMVRLAPTPVVTMIPVPVFTRPEAMSAAMP